MGGSDGGGPHVCAWHEVNTQVSYDEFLMNFTDC